MRTVRTVRALAMSVAMAVPLAGLIPATAAEAAAPSCPSRQSAPVFSWALDPNLYFPMPGGDFEDGGRTWSTAGSARVVDGINETVMPASDDDSHALNLPAGTSATAAPLCVNGTATLMRFFARSRGLAGIALVVVTARTDSGATQVLLSPALPLTPAWSAPLLLFRLPLLGDEFTSVTVSIKSIGLGGIDVDDVYVDPLKQH